MEGAFMGDPIAEIKVELRQPIVNQEQAAAHRKRLNERFAQLNQDQATDILNEILTLSKTSTLPHDFRRLDRAVRLELMLRAVSELGTQNANSFHDFLTAKKDSPLRRGLLHVFPDYAKPQRDEFLNALVKPASNGRPRITLLFRNRGKFSGDNMSPLAVDGVKKGTVRNLLGPDPDDGTNQMEIRGLVADHRAGADYHFNRTIQMKMWYLAGKTWKLWKEYPAGSPDNTHNADEDDHPDNDHIYSIDSPGWTFSVTQPDFDDIPRDLRSSVTELVYMLNAIETAHVRVDSGNWEKAAELKWFSVTWLEKVDGTWRRKPGSNKIQKGSIDDLEFATEPPTAF
jgi:hypothetical protein